MDKTIRTMQEVLALVAGIRELVAIIESTAQRIATNAEPVTDAELDALAAQRRAALERLAKLGS